MSCEVDYFYLWLQNVCERDYGVREELERIFKEKRRKKRQNRKAFEALNRK